MERNSMRGACLVALFLGGVLRAGIPEPDAVLYGTASVNGAPVQQQHPVVLVAVLDTGQEIGRYDFADCNADGVRDACELSCATQGCSGVSGCGTARDTAPPIGQLDDCPGNLYALKVRTESTPDGVAPSGNAVVLDFANPRTVRILMQQGTNPAQFVRNLLINERGKIRQLALSVLNRFAFRDYAKCQRGPAVTTPGGSCSAELFAGADYDEDGDVDLRDYAFVQNHFVGQ